MKNQFGRLTILSIGLVLASSPTTAAVVSTDAYGHSYMGTGFSGQYDKFAESTSYVWAHGIASNNGNFAVVAVTAYKGVENPGGSPSMTLISLAVNAYVGGSSGIKIAQYSMDGGYRFTIDTPMELTISGYVSTAAPIAYPTTTTFQYALWESSPAYPISSVLVQNGFQWLNFTVVLTPGTYRFGTSTQVGTGVEPVVPLPVTAKVDAKLLMRIREVGLPETPSPFPTSDEERFEFLTQTVGPTPTAPDGDSDADGFPDAVDNCKLLTNLSQCDSDGDGFGNHCDADMNNNNTTNAQDYVLFRAQLGQPSVSPTYNYADLNCNVAVNSQDYVLFRGLLGSPPGPSGLVP